MKRNKTHRDLKGDQGFSLIELVIAVGILAILSVVGVVAYKTLTNQARQSAVENAAAVVLKAAAAYDIDGTKEPIEAKNEWMDSSGNERGNKPITVELTDEDRCITVSAVHEAGNSAERSYGTGCEGGSTTPGNSNEGSTIPGGSDNEGDPTAGDDTTNDGTTNDGDENTDDGSSNPDNNTNDGDQNTGTDTDNDTNDGSTDPDGNGSEAGDDTDENTNDEEGEYTQPDTTDAKYYMFDLAYNIELPELDNKDVEVVVSSNVLQNFSNVEYLEYGGKASNVFRLETKQLTDAQMRNIEIDFVVRDAQTKEVYTTHSVKTNRDELQLIGRYGMTFHYLAKYSIK